MFVWGGWLPGLLELTSDDVMSQSYLSHCAIRTDCVSESHFNAVKQGPMKIDGATWWMVIFINCPKQHLLLDWDQALGATED